MKVLIFNPFVLIGSFVFIRRLHCAILKFLHGYAGQDPRDGQIQH